jgi:nitrile hydratase
MDPAEPARFQPGDRVTVRVGNPPTHYRTPRYVQGKPGRIDASYGAFPNPESLAYGGDGRPRQPLYRVAFRQTDLWEGYRGSPGDQVLIDLYQHWLEPYTD